MGNNDFSISLLVGLKNNLEYSKNFYETTRNIYPYVEIIFVSYGSTDGTHEWLDSLEDSNMRFYYELINKSLADAYNKCIELATKDYMVLLHNDMVLTPYFLENIAKHLNDNTVVGYSFIEPPIYSGDERIGKIVKDFGTDIQSLRLKDLYKFSGEKRLEYSGQVSHSIELRFFLSLETNILKRIGGFDNLFSPMFFEDDDIFLRLEQLNMKMITSLDAICYHFVSKTSRFSEEAIKKTKEIEENSQRNFSRKWGFSSYNDRSATYKTAILLKNANIDLIREVEPYATHLYVDNNFDEYIREEQRKTKYDLSKRIFSITDFRNSYPVTVNIDGEKLDERSFKYIRRINSIVNKRKNEKRVKKILHSLFYKHTIRKANLLIKINL
ncbi:MAG: glycosyltransferase [Prevotella sp.]|jgi:GT2 family glycosyltransferase|nr:glycosyltransferase [Prevotella sp.]